MPDQEENQYQYRIVEQDEKVNPVPGNGLIHLVICDL